MGEESPKKFPKEALRATRQKDIGHKRENAQQCDREQ
jgi:hypothetical protein